MVQEQMKKIKVFLGSYAEPESAGVYVGTFDTQEGRIEIIHEVSGLKNPTFLSLSSDKKRLYAITEATNANGERSGAAVSYIIQEDGSLNKLNEVYTVGGPTCHITLDQTNKSMMVASYHGGMIGILPLDEEGKICEEVDVHQHKGSSTHPVQTQPRAHSVNIDPHNRFALACDLGTDEIITYQLDAEKAKLKPIHKVKVSEGSGPRHFAFHPSGSFGYVINELNATVTAFRYDSEVGQLEEIQTISTLPEGYTGEKSCADIHVSPDGRFLYGSNRGHDSIVVYQIDPVTGRLSLVEHVSTGGQHPRNFSLSPNGRYLLVANRDTNNIVVFARDEETGRLTKTGNTLEVSKPVCIRF